MTIFSHDPHQEFTQDELAEITNTEWLVTNGLSGYASGTVAGTLTRVFHGYLIAGLPSPLGRTMMLNDILEQVQSSDESLIDLNGLERENGAGRVPAARLASFRLESGLPVWSYEIEGLVIEKRVYMPHRQNTTYVNYRVAGGSGKLKLRLRPLVNMRDHEAPVDTVLDTYAFTVRNQRYEIRPSNHIPHLRLMLLGHEGAFTIDTKTIEDVTYVRERRRGYAWRGDLWSPGYFSAELSPGCEATIVASTENWATMSALSPQHAWDLEQERRRRLLLEAHPNTCSGMCQKLVWAADQFIFTPVGRQEDTARARAAGDEIRSIIAGYHWFTDWGRDTMISLEGLALVTGRYVEASYILRTFGHYIRDGLIPNMFPEGKKNGLYHTADATLWFFHALGRYFEYTEDNHLLKYMLPRLLDIVDHHLRGTKFNIRADPADGLLSQGQEGYQLTWMDAKVEDWVVTPRRGKAVEVNALWYNALCLLERWLRKLNRPAEAKEIAGHAAKARESFNRVFWYEEGGYLYDVVDGENGRPDACCRPNQLFAISLEHPVLDELRWEPVLEVVRKKLLTPVGLRSLAPGERDYKPRYDGDLRARDAAYHQGTVWAWLIGPFIDTWLRVHPDDLKGARRFLDGFREQMQSACAGTISEVFDAEPPFTARGCCAQAWSVAEVLRSLVKTAGQAEAEQEPNLVSEMVT